MICWLRRHSLATRPIKKFLRWFPILNYVYFWHPLFSEIYRAVKSEMEMNALIWRIILPPKVFCRHIVFTSFSNSFNLQFWWCPILNYVYFWHPLFSEIYRAHQCSPSYKLLLETSSKQITFHFLTYVWPMFPIKYPRHLLWNYWLIDRFSDVLYLCFNENLRKDWLRSQETKCIADYL